MKDYYYFIVLCTILLNYANVGKTQYWLYVISEVTYDYFNKNANDMDVLGTTMFL